MNFLSSYYLISKLFKFLSSISNKLKVEQYSIFFYTQDIESDKTRIGSFSIYASPQTQLNVNFPIFLYAYLLNLYDNIFFFFSLYARQEDFFRK